MREEQSWEQAAEGLRKAELKVLCTLGAAEDQGCGSRGRASAEKVSLSGAPSQVGTGPGAGSLRDWASVLQACRLRHHALRLGKAALRMESLCCRCPVCSL